MKIVDTFPKGGNAASSVQQNEKLQKGRLRSIDCLRGAAAVAVLLCHAVKFAARPPNEAVVYFFKKLITEGRLGVPLFFVISGFCIHLRWTRRFSISGKETLDYLVFWKRRFFRLYPTYFVALCISMAMVGAAYFMGLQRAMLDEYAEPKIRSIIMDFITHVFMLHGFFPAFDHAGGNTALWTLAREEYFYLMYCVLLPVRRYFGLVRSLAAVSTLGVVFPFVMQFVISRQSIYWNVINTSALVLWIQWCLGMASVESYYGLIHLPQWCRWIWVVPIWAALAYASSTYFPALEPLMWGMTFFTLVNWAVRLESNGEWFDSRGSRWLSSVGIFSYSLYLIHVPARAAMRYMLGSIGEQPSVFGYFWGVAVISAASYFVAKVFFALIERRFIAEK